MAQYPIQNIVRNIAWLAKLWEVEEGALWRAGELSAATLLGWKKTDAPPYKANEKTVRRLVDGIGRTFSEINHVARLSISTVSLPQEKFRRTFSTDDMEFADVFSELCGQAVLDSRVQDNIAQRLGGWYGIVRRGKEDEALFHEVLFIGQRGAVGIECFLITYSGAVERGTFYARLESGFVITARPDRNVSFSARFLMFDIPITRKLEPTTGYMLHEGLEFLNVLASPFVIYRLDDEGWRLSESMEALSTNLPRWARTGGHEPDSLSGGLSQFRQAGLLGPIESGDPRFEEVASLLDRSREFPTAREGASWSPTSFEVPLRPKEGELQPPAEPAEEAPRPDDEESVDEDVLASIDKTHARVTPDHRERAARLLDDLEQVVDESRINDPREVERLKEGIATLRAEFETPLVSKPVLQRFVDNVLKPLGEKFKDSAIGKACGALLDFLVGLL